MNDKTDIFLSVVQANKGIIYKVVNSYCKSIEDREDLVQEIIIQLWKSFDKYNKEVKYSTWMYQIALNVAISFYRKENTRKQIASPLTESIIEFTDDGYDDKETNLGILQRMILQLADLDKALILLYLEEKSHKEIAQIMGISESNVATKIGRIKKILKEKMENFKSQ
ncbi:RNA polymerase sigma factor [Flectobacillus major]|jgi:RNA polymerase sigma-70 factor (ECF subfamily)|uniref:RNA polymerase sigma factor n=1 Tax=Flectobacillus major TaxID=103 RepID=UPI00040F0590|nr:RNA polymerase sigma factor [Flectobacillus major]